MDDENRQFNKEWNFVVVWNMLFVLSVGRINPMCFICHGTIAVFYLFLFIKTYLYSVVHNQTILILFYSVSLFLAKSKSRDN